jgi:hypothetical protein
MQRHGSVRSTKWLVPLLPALIACAAQARDQDRPITSREPDAFDVAKTPMTDLNLSRTEIPALLVEAELRPYSLQNVDTCEQISAAIAELDSTLGPDLDLPQAERARFSKGRVAQWAIGKFIPFRSLIREVSGANRQEREIRVAIQAGMARRGFLKGVGISRGCAYPASPANEAIVARHMADLAREDSDSKGPSVTTPDPAITPSTPADPAPKGQAATAFTSQPMVQPTP